MPKEPKGRSKKPQELRKDNPVIEYDALDEKGQELRTKHDRITDKQHELVVTILQSGCTITEACNRIDANRSWASSTLSKQHVSDYMRDLAISAIGVHALRATATMGSLLNAKSEKVRQEAAKDLLDRAGFGLTEAEKAPSLVINISV